jgi:hypothetical protein
MGLSRAEQNDIALGLLMAGKPRIVETFRAQGVSWRMEKGKPVLVFSAIPSAIVEEIEAPPRPAADLVRDMRAAGFGRRVSAKVTTPSGLWGWLLEADPP